MPSVDSVITVFGSSRPRPGDEEYKIAFDVGEQLAKAGFVICNGGYGGTMEASARGAREARAKTIGVTCSSFGPRQANNWITENITEQSLVARLVKLITLGDAYVILKGGTGTLLELAAVWEFMNKLEMAEKPIVVVGGFWNGVVSTLKDELAWEGKEECTRYVKTVRTPEECAQLLVQRLKDNT